MKIFYGLNDFLKHSASSGRFAVTIGVFDGVHRAHREIVKALVKKARKKKLSTLLITFHPHPANVVNLSRKVPLLISLKHRLRLTEEMGLDYAVILRFDRRMSRMSAAGFIKKVLGKIPISEIVVGSNFLFGRNREGSSEGLKRFSSSCGYNVTVIRVSRSAGKSISSTRIRKHVLKGELAKASRLLSRPVAVLGTVMKGHTRGRIIGYPTANINPHHEAIPPFGVYAVKIRLAGKLHKGILNIGLRPTFRDDFRPDAESTIEAHIFDFKRNIYGRDLEIIFVKRIRKERKFKNISLLKEQIKRDEKCARRILR